MLHAKSENILLRWGLLWHRYRRSYVRITIEQVNAELVIAIGTTPVHFLLILSVDAIAAKFIRSVLHCTT